MASETIVAVYDTPAHAELAIADLTAAGIPEHAIQHYTGEQYGYGSYDAARDSTASGITGSAPEPQTYDPARDPSARADAAYALPAAERSEGLWSWLFGDDKERHHQSAYDRSLRSGGTVVTVIVEDALAERALSILEEHSPVDLEERHAGSDGIGVAAPAPAATQPASDHTGIGSTGRVTEEVIPLSEEALEVGKREVDRGTTRVRRYVVERPVEAQVRLRDEKVSIFRRPVTNAAVTDAFTEKSIDVREMAEEAVVGKTARVVEEVVVRKGIEERSETVRDTVRREEVEITGPHGGAVGEPSRAKTA